jgi:hypothetical protein
LGFGAVWAVLAAGQWLMSSSMFVKVGYTVLAAAWLGMGLLQIAQRKRRRDQGAPAQQDVRPSTSRWGPGRPEEHWH